MAAWCDKIYGDNYEIRGDFVERIGNNVSLEFDNMDFGEEGVSKVIISGRAPIDNTIHIRFENEQGQDSRLVEFKKSDEYTVKVFELEKVSGRQKVTFLFLPGSNFDFGWFKFEK